MKYILSHHARLRMQERSIAERLLADTLQDPTKIELDNKGKFLFKKLYKKEGRERLLLVVAIRAGNALKIVTVIDTSKVRKYL